jgi:hypothetical protein
MSNLKCRKLRSTSPCKGEVGREAGGGGSSVDLASKAPWTPSLTLPLSGGGNERASGPYRLARIEM